MSEGGRKEQEGITMTIEQKFDMLGIDNAPGQEALQKSQALELRGEPLPGRWLISPMEMWTPISLRRGALRCSSGA